VAAADRGRVPVTTETAPESVTVDELTKALIRVEHPCGTKDECASCRGKAITLLSHVAAQRGPQYEPGAPYADPGGNCWWRTDDGQWLAPGTKSAYAHDYPQRPLRRLVPLPGRADLIAALEEDLSREHGYDGQANRVLALLEGAHEGHYGDDDDD
jgi:hypothetical protein